MIPVLLLLLATGHGWPQQPRDASKLAGLVKLAGGDAAAENEVVKSQHTEDGGRLDNRQNGKAGNRWQKMRGILLSRDQKAQQDQEHSTPKAKFQQVTIGGGQYGSVSGKNHDFNLLVAFEQFLGEDLRQAGKSAGRAGSSKKISKTVGTDGNERQSSETQPEVKKNRRERGESEGREISDESLSKLGKSILTEEDAGRENHLERIGVDAKDGGENQREAKDETKQGPNAEEEMLRQVVDMNKVKEKEERLAVSAINKVLSNKQSVAKLLGENPVSVPGNGNDGQENALSMKGAEEERPEIKDREQQPATEFSQTEMDSKEGDGREKKKKTRKLGGENKNDLNGALTAQTPATREKGLEQPMALTKRAKEEDSTIHSMPHSPWILASALALALVCILAVLGLGCHIHRPGCSSSGSKSPFSDLSPTFQSAKLSFSKTPPEEASTPERRTENRGTRSRDLSPKDGLTKGTTGSRAHKFAEWEGRNRPAGSVAVTEHLVEVGTGDMDEEDNDMVYECPGLAPHGEMVVTNPFFMSHQLTEERGKDTKAPCPVNVNNNMRHGSINRNLH